MKVTYDNEIKNITCRPPGILCPCCQQISTEPILEEVKLDEIIDNPIIKWLFNNAGSSNFSF